MQARHSATATLAGCGWPHYRTNTRGICAFPLSPHVERVEDFRLMARAVAIISQRCQLGAALVTQRILTEAALGPLFAALDGATVQIILFEVVVTSLVNYSSIAGASSTFLGHAREISDSGDRFWRPHAASPPRRE